jgi:hypothetical protein
LGIVTYVFQDGHFEDVLNFESTGAITAWFPLILFGLSMGYHVFILSGIKEAVDRGQSTSEAVSHGIKSTAGVVTGAAILRCHARTRRAAAQPAEPATSVAGSGVSELDRQLHFLTRPDVPRLVRIIHFPHQREARLLEHAAALGTLERRVGRDATHVVGGRGS